MSLIDMVIGDSKSSRSGDQVDDDTEQEEKKQCKVKEPESVFLQYSSDELNALIAERDSLKIECEKYNLKLKELQNQQKRAVQNESKSFQEERLRLIQEHKARLAEIRKRKSEHLRPTKEKHQNELELLSNSHQIDMKHKRLRKMEGEDMGFTIMERLLDEDNKGCWVAVWAYDCPWDPENTKKVDAFQFEVVIPVKSKKALSSSITSDDEIRDEMSSINWVVDDLDKYPIIFKHQGKEFELFDGTLPVDWSLMEKRKLFEDENDLEPDPETIELRCGDFDDPRYGTGKCSKFNLFLYAFCPFPSQFFK